MSAPFKVGDWVRTHASHRAAFEVLAVRAAGLDLGYFGFATFASYPMMIPVRVTFPKPPRKLTLSAGLAWLKTRTELGLASFNLGGGQVWGIWNFNNEDWFLRDPGGGALGYDSPTCAIIAARKALGVKL